MVPVLRRLRQDGQVSGAILDCVEKPYFKMKAETKQQPKTKRKENCTVPV